MGSVNKVILLGNLGADPEIRMTSSGQQVASMSIATAESWTKDGKREENTEWHRVVLWRKLAELASKYLKKGRSVFIEGRRQTRSWQGQSGQKRYTTETIATQLTFVDSGGRAEQPQAYPSNVTNIGPYQTNTNSSPHINDDFSGSNVPF